MKISFKVLQVVVLVAAALIVGVVACKAQGLDKPVGHVADAAHLLTANQSGILESELGAFEKKTSIEIAIVTVPGLDGQSIEDYTRNLANRWGVGKRGQNNGIVFLVAPSERKMRIEVASGARRFLADERADYIRDQAILPRFRAGDMAGGVYDGARLIMQLAGESAHATVTATQARAPMSMNSKISVFVGMATVIALLWVVIATVNRRAARRYVLEKNLAIAEKFSIVWPVVSHADTKEQHRAKFKEISDRFAAFEHLAPSSKGVKWDDVKDKADLLYYELKRVEEEALRDIAFAKKAREKGPELMKKFPEMLEAVRAKANEGKLSPRAQKHLQEAQVNFTGAQSAEMAGCDWLIIYGILCDAQANLSNANLAAASGGGSSSSALTSGSSDMASSSPSFGGGFDGGGSTGSW